MNAKPFLLILFSCVAGCGAKAGPAPHGSRSGQLLLDPTQFPGDDIGAQVNAACASANGQMVEVLIPAGSYCLQTQINPVSHCSIRGNSSADTSLNANYANCMALGANAAILVRGTVAAHVTDIRIGDLAVTNGTPLTYGAQRGMDGIRAEYCDRCNFQSLHVHSIAGYFAIVWKHATQIVVSGNTIDNFYYAGITGLTGSQYVWIQDNQVSGAVNRSGDNGLAYGIGAAGYEDDAGASGPFSEHVWITNNHVSDIPTWECYDTHGGFDQHFIGNYGSGCYFGLQAGTVLNAASAEGLDNLEIAGNHLDRGNGNANGYGIVVAGAGPANPATNTVVTNNVVSGYGSQIATTVGAITLMGTRNVQITDNQIPSYYQAAILFYANNWNTTVTGNIGGDLLGSLFPQYRCMIALDSIGNWGLSVDNNSAMPSSSDTTPFSFLCDGNKANQVSFGPNNHVPTPCGFWGDQFLPLCLTQLPSANDQQPLNFVPGDIGYAPNYQPAYTFAAPAGGNNGYYSLDSSSIIVTGDLDQGSAIVRNIKGGLGNMFWYYWLPTGMNVTVEGAGAASAGLAAQVLSNDGYTITLSALASATVHGANIRWQGGTVQ
jgi:hypothetical protein